MHGIERLSVALAKNSATHLEGLPDERKRKIIVTLFLVEQTEVIHGEKRVGMILAENAALGFESLPDERKREFISALRLIQ
jgi:hypothetical protein